MRCKMTWAAAGIALASAALYSGRALATPAVGFTGTTIAMGRLGDIDVLNSMVLPTDEHGQGNKIWLGLQKSKGASDLYVQNNVWEPGGSTGWHTHPGHSLILVTAGAVTVYGAEDEGCKPTVYTQGMGFVDAGGHHVHLIKNEGSVEARTVAVQLIPADAVRRIDAERPEGCLV
jgi:quercetin dioxygenase-like cupin family protein